MIGRRRPATVAVIAALSALAAPGLRADEACAPDAGSTQRVLGVVDGQTLRLDDGREVRLAGVLPPQGLATQGSSWPPARDAARALEALVAGRAVMLRHAGRRQDRYGRTLAQVYARGAAGDEWLQHRLVSQGYARASALPGQAACLGPLMAAEAEARTARRGLWADGVFTVQRAEDVDVLLNGTGHFAIVQGRVAEVTRTQRITYINFSRDWRRDFTASLASSVVDRTPGGAERASALSGKTVRVRGWIERRNGPMIVLGSLDEIEVLDSVP